MHFLQTGAYHLQAHYKHPQGGVQSSLLNPDSSEDKKPASGAQAEQLTDTQHTSQT